MLYFDTSFLVPLILPEATSNRISDFIRGLPESRFAVSHWTRIEFSSVIGRQVRMGSVGADAGRQAIARFEALLEGSCVILLPSAGDFSLAREYLGRFETGLRAGDALHLAIARNNRAEAIYSLDKAFIKAGNMLGLPLRTGIRVG